MHAFMHAFEEAMCIDILDYSVGLALFTGAKRSLTTYSTTKSHLRSNHTYCIFLSDLSRVSQSVVWLGYF
jgi:hypothetical protein